MMFLQDTSYSYGRGKEDGLMERKDEKEREKIEREKIERDKEEGEREKSTGI